MEGHAGGQPEDEDDHNEVHDHNDHDEDHNHRDCDAEDKKD